MELGSPIPHKKARIEIIPLIDIMFFLLASFMMVSLSQTHMKGIQVNLPAPNSQPADPTKKDYVSIRVTEGGLVYFDNEGVLSQDVKSKLFGLQKANPDIKVSISAETNALHGDVIAVLDDVRDVQIKKIGYQIKPSSTTGAPGTVPAPPGPAAPPPPPK